MWQGLPAPAKTSLQPKTYPGHFNFCSEDMQLPVRAASAEGGTAQSVTFVQYLGKPKCPPAMSGQFGVSILQEPTSESRPDGEQNADARAHSTG